MVYDDIQSPEYERSSELWGRCGKGKQVSPGMGV